MGGSWSSRRGLKRPHEDQQHEAATPAVDETTCSDIHTPKRKRVQSTSKYIVKTLFEEGVNSDITIEALGMKWPLHKFYLQQCHYFDSMFSGKWSESDQSTIKMEITDNNISPEALRIAFRSLYTDNIFVKPVQAVRVAAAASMFQIDSLLEHCKKLMTENINRKTVCAFLSASELYGLTDIKKFCLTWLHRNLMVPSNAAILSDISAELLVDLLDSQELWTLQVEVDVYTLLKKWIFTKLNPSWTGNGEQLLDDAHHFFRHRTKSNSSSCCFLQTEEGSMFVHLFEKVLWRYVISDMTSLSLLLEDRLIPIDWLNPFFATCWLHHLKTEEGSDKGPTDVSDEEFFKHAMRCGRLLVQEQEYCWRWLGYHYGLDLLFTLRNRMLVVERNSGLTQNFEGSLSQQYERLVMLSVRVAQMANNEDIWNSEGVLSTGILRLSFGSPDSLDAEHVLCILPRTMEFPLQVSMRMLCTMPSADLLPQPKLAVAPLLLSPHLLIAGPDACSMTAGEEEEGGLEPEGLSTCEFCRLGQCRCGSVDPSKIACGEEDEGNTTLQESDTHCMAVVNSLGQVIPSLNAR